MFLPKQKKFIIFAFLWAFLFLSFSLKAIEDILPPNQLYLGPEIYHVHRMKKGGSKQDGVIYGGRIGYDRIKAWGFYWGGDALRASGMLKGHTGQGFSIRSRFIDTLVEGRFGYTFQQMGGNCLSFTPFLGGGYTWEVNNFTHSSPLPIHTLIRYGYFCAGFLSKINFTPNLNAGINFKAKWMFEGRCIVTHDPDFGKNTMLVKDEVLYRVELPFTYQFCTPWYLGIVPFYEYRHYGGHANFPFDFIDTKLNIYGLLIKFMYCL